MQNAGLLGIESFLLCFVSTTFTFLCVFFVCVLGSPPRCVMAWSELIVAFSCLPVKPVLGGHSNRQNKGLKD